MDYSIQNWMKQPQDRQEVFGYYKVELLEMVSNQIADEDDDPRWDVIVYAQVQPDGGWHQIARDNVFNPSIAARLFTFACLYYELKIANDLLNANHGDAPL